MTELVEAFDICPFARGARTSGALKREVLLDERADPAASLKLLDELAADERVVVAILIYPRLGASLAAFEQFLVELRRAEELRRGGRSPFVTALFHPALRWSAATPSQLVTFFRRSPDPSIQFVRFSALEALRAAAPSGKFMFEWTEAGFAELLRREKNQPVSARITADNFAMVAREGIARLEAIFSDIALDRALTHVRLGEKAPGAT